MLLESKQSEPLGVSWLVCGDPPPSAKGEGTDAMLKAYINNLPALLRTTGANLGPFEQQLIEAARVTTPMQNQLQLDTSREFMPQFTELGLQDERQVGLGRIGNETEMMEAAAPWATALRGLEDAANPEMAKIREASMGPLLQMMGSLSDPSQMSATERAEIERSLARDRVSTGNVNPTSSATVDAAMQFGDAGEARKRDKQGAIQAALQSAIGAGQSFSSPVNAYGAVTGKSTPLYTQGQMSMADKPTEGMGLSQGLLGQTGENVRGAQQINANRRSGLDVGLGAAQALSPCCFIFLEALNGPLPPYVRKCRDRYAWAKPECVAGYRNLSAWLVPMMRKFSLVKGLINFIMVKPIMKYGEYVVYRKQESKKYKPVFRFWMNIWKSLA